MRKRRRASESCAHSGRAPIDAAKGPGSTCTHYLQGHGRLSRQRPTLDRFSDVELGDVGTDLARDRRLGERSVMHPERAYYFKMSLPTLAAALDIAAGQSGIARDVREVADEGWPGWVVLVIVFALPVVSLILLSRRRWLALVSLCISLALFSSWFLYYATDWWSNPGQGAWVPALALVLLGWFVLSVELWRTRRGQL